MNRQQIEQALIERANIATQLAEINKGYDSMRNKIIPLEVQAELDAIEAERKSVTEQALTKFDELESQIKAAVVQLGDTVKVPNVAMAVYNKGRITWDSKGLEGLMVAIPEIGQFRKEGEPYTTIRGA